MKTLRFFVFTFLLTIFVGLPFSFAQGVDTSGHHVKLIYFIPSDRTPQPDIDTKIDALIKETQQFFADEMERHGYSRKTFRFEADENGNAIVHHIKSPDDDKHYHNWVGDTSGTVRGYFEDDYDLQKYIFLAFLDVSTEILGADWAGYCGFWGGTAWVPASGHCFDVRTVAHEIGHGFGLTHNFHDDTYIMSYGANTNAVSACAAEWLDVSPYFNPNKLITSNRNTTIKMLSNTFDTTSPYAQRLRFEINDPDQLHQVQLIIGGERFAEYVDCQSLHGTNDIVEFAITDNIKGVGIHVIDKDGNYIQEGFDIGTTLIPHTEVVSIPDVNLATVIRKQLDYPPEKQITMFDMTRIHELTAEYSNIIDLTGFQHAVGVRQLNLRGNMVQDITALTALTSIQTLQLGENQITDISPLAKMKQLKELVIYNNQITDISPLAAHKNLSVLVIGNNQITNISTLTSLTDLTYLVIGDNQITDITPVASLTSLTVLSIGDNRITDISTFTSLIDLEHLSIGRNQITDISPLAAHKNLVNLRIGDNRITDISTLASLTDLEHLSIGRNQITDITAFAQMLTLRSLRVSQNQITDMSPITELTALQELEMSYNQIEDISPLANIPNLKHLFLDYNQIRDVSVLADMVTLKRLVLVGNPIRSKKPLLALLRKNPDVEIYLKSGSILPVTLSSFKATRTADGAVINWTTESEVDNAGFNILRSRTKTGEFEKINAKLIQGAGTTGERSTYTWTDTTAKPNTVYYYRIEDVSHAGVHQTLATTRLRGLISAKGKMITQWGILKK